MDNFRRQSFITKSDLDNKAIAFTSIPDIVNKKITKIYVPMFKKEVLPIGATSGSSMYNGNFFTHFEAKSIYDENNVNILSSTIGNKVVRYCGYKVGTVSTSGTNLNFSFKFASASYPQTCSFSLWGCSFYTYGQYGYFSGTDTESKYFSVNLNLLKALLGVDDIPYMCIDFTKIEIDNSNIKVAYIMTNSTYTNKIFTTNAINAGMEEICPFYYEEYTE